MNFLSLRFGVVVLVVLTMFTLLCSLGFWQLDRANTKEKMIQQMNAAEQTAAIFNNLNLVNLAQPLQQRYQKIKLNGMVLNKTILLDNQIHNKQAGYDVL